MMCLMKRNFILLLVSLTLTNCIKDIEDVYTVKSIDVATIESLISSKDLNDYPSVKDTTGFPLMAWRGIPDEYISIERFQEVKASGINLMFYPYKSIENMQIVLDYAEQMNIKVLISCPGLITQTEMIVNLFKDHPANAGYFLQDEPSASHIPTLKKLAETIESIDNTRFAYINLLPNFFSPKDYAVGSYEEYIRKFITEIPLKMLSFDHYPVVSNYIRPSWYYNLAFIRDEAEKAGIPFWAFVLTSAHWSYPVPTIDHLRMQVYSNLAYGAKGIQYFTYWMPDRDPYISGPINNKGIKTNEYYLLQEINKEIHNLSYIFQTSKVTKVSHYGDIPQRTTQFTNAPYFVESIDIKGGDALLSEMENEDNSFFMIQNTNLHREIGIDIQTDNQTKIVLKNGIIIPASLIKEEFKLTPGDMVMFMR